MSHRGSTLQYDVMVSGLLATSAPPMPDGERPHWSPLSHTLIHGPTEAVIVDPPITVAQTSALADWIAASGKRLAYVYITHWHADHWLGTSELAKRFPGVTVYATEATIARMAKATPDGVPGATWSTLDNQPTGQFYTVITDDQIPFRAYGAQQDSTTVSISSRAATAATERPANSNG